MTSGCKEIVTDGTVPDPAMTLVWVMGLAAASAAGLAGRGGFEIASSGKKG